MWQEFALFGIASILFGVLDKNADDTLRGDAARVIAAFLMVTLLYHILAMVYEVFNFTQKQDEETVLSFDKRMKQKRKEAKLNKIREIYYGDKAERPFSAQGSDAPQNADRLEKEELLNRDGKTRGAEKDSSFMSTDNLNQKM
jgi:hypothetical protein